MKVFSLERRPPLGHVRDVERTPRLVIAVTGRGRHLNAAAPPRSPAPHEVLLSNCPQGTVDPHRLIAVCVEHPQQMVARSGLEIRKCVRLQHEIGASRKQSERFDIGAANLIDDLTAQAVDARS